MKLINGLVSALIIGSVVGTYLLNQTTSEAQVITKQDRKADLSQNIQKEIPPTVLTQKVAPPLVITKEDQKNVEAIVNLIPNSGGLTYYQKQDGTGFFFKKSQER